MFILKNLVNDSFNYNNDNLNEKPLVFHSDVLINMVVEDWKSLLLFIEVKNKTSSKFKINNKELRKLIWYVIESLAKNNLIERNVLFIENNVSQTVFNIKTLYKNIHSFTEIYYKPFTIYERNAEETYIYNEHYLSFKVLFKKNKKSEESFIFDINKTPIQNLLNTFIYIDRKLLTWVIREYCVEYGIVMQDIEENYEKTRFFLIEKIKNKDSKSIEETSKLLSIYQKIRKLNSILKENFDNKKIYFPIMFDFRSRQYCLSDISPTFNKEFRYCSYIGHYDKCPIQYNHVSDIVIENVLSQQFELLKQFPINLSHLNDKQKTYIIWLLISLVEIIKSKINKEIHVSEFIKIGINFINNENSFNLKYEDRIKFNYIKYVIEDIIYSISDKKWLISKDVTASCFQHLLKLLGAKNEDSYKWCNLKSLDTWYDTYAYIIDFFKKEVMKNFTYKYINIEEFNNLFNRKNLKKTIMTESYSAGLDTCFKYFKLSINWEDYEDNKKNEIREIFQKFYKYITEHNVLFKHNTKDLNNAIKDLNDEIEFSDGGKIALSYYKELYRDINIMVNYKGKVSRFTKIEKFLSNVIDKDKTQIARIANYIHANDASLARWYWNKKKGLVIHDCFLIDYKHITYLVSILNEGMRIKFHDAQVNKNDNEIDKIFSLFIVI